MEFEKIRKCVAENASGEVSLKDDLIVLNPVDAANVVFSILTGKEGDADFVRYVGQTFHQPVDSWMKIGNHLLYEGNLSFRWFEPDRPGSRDSIKLCLEANFGLALAKEEGVDPEAAYVIEIGRLASEFSSPPQTTL